MKSILFYREIHFFTQTEWNLFYVKRVSFFKKDWMHFIGIYCQFAIEMPIV